MVQNRGIIGHVEWNDGSPASGLVIDVKEKDLLFYDILPSGKTNENGDFIISYHPEIYGGTGVFAELPDIELLIKYRDTKRQEKTIKKFYKKVKSEWLKINLKLELLPSDQICETEIIPIGRISHLVNLNNFLDLENIKKNDLWEIFLGTSMALSRQDDTMKFSTWGGRVITGDIFENPLSRNEKDLNSNGIKALNERKKRPILLKLNFFWLNKQNEIIHEHVIENKNMNFLNERGLRISIPKIENKLELDTSLPIEHLKITSEVQIKEKKFNFELFCMENLSSLKSFVTSSRI